jgi:hypothetical protein
MTLSRLDLTGNRYGRLTAVRFLGGASDVARWECKCDCGAVVNVMGSSLRQGRSKSCGCYQRDRVAERNRTRSHGATANGKWTPEYRAWMSMKTRCAGNPDRSDFANYTQRGITICERWLNSFETFFADVGLKPSPKHSLDRINNDGNYEPSNVRWATACEQGANRSNNRLVSYRGKNIALTEALRMAGSVVSFACAASRLDRGWPLDKSLELPTSTARLKRRVESPTGAPSRFGGGVAA